MNAQDILSRYYDTDTELYRILKAHSEDVTGKALQIARMHAEMNLDTGFIEEAAMLHDIGIFLCDAPDIYCRGKAAYICHGYLGADLVRREGYPLHALVCERHTGAGLSAVEIAARNLPLPVRDMLPVSGEERLICFADKFFSKTRLGKEKSVDRITQGLSRYGDEQVARFRALCKLFLG
ncbi:MAG: phosphohydrolase [Tannerellaceae bacterium]|jgi:uncharacterized protein|nr:phosphohydrolase [Tannerellaceae bacterium]